MDDRFEIGLFLPVGGEGMMGGESARWSDLRAMTQRAENLGYDFVGVLDHLLFHHWECWTVMSALAEATSRIKLISYVTCTGYRNPALLARMADTLDEISGGRLVLGLGAGDSNTEHEKFGYPTDRLVSRFEEAVQIIQQLSKHGRLDAFAGEFYSMRDITFEPRGRRAGGPEILIGSLGGPRMMRLTARFADIWTAALPATGGTPDGFRALAGRLDAVCADIGREPASIGRMAEAVVQLPGGPEPEWMDGHVTRGTLDEIAAELSQYCEQGAGQLMVWIEPNSVEGIERFAPILKRLKG
jgi:alkanesulfonate monooxygenase SsuD/methylene tetrahydromethanopterin reductase-like flavin-dependent oxidoreductase (luciferase family)